MKKTTKAVALLLILSFILVSFPEIKSTKTPLNPRLLTQKDGLEIIVNQINETRFTWFDSILANTIGPRPYSSTSNMQAAEFIADELNSTGTIFATYQWFSYAGGIIPNVIGTLPSADPSNQGKIVVGAHFDTVPEAPGADDNGSGTALLLEVAKVLSQFRFNHTIEFVAFNAEEASPYIHGSRYYVQQALQAREDILLMINIDMVLWDNPNAPPNEKLWILYEETVPYEYGERFADVALNTSYTYTTTPIQKTTTTMGVSDHVSFWDAGIPALCICESMCTQNPHYHQPTDSMDAEEYNFTLGAKAAQVVAATIAKLAGIRTLYDQLTFSFTFGEEAYHITTSSNSSVTDFYFDPDDGAFIKFNVIGPNGTTGFCNVTIPEDLVRGEFSVYVDGFSLVEDEDYTQTYNGTHHSFYINYTHTTHVIEIRGTDVIPELPPWTLPSLLLVTTLVIVVHKKKLLNQTAKSS
ncbi:MAG: M20/M25/M40 family metallo-hydrolase [Candidatus Bathyarchaeota archaeon]|jgi:hypothetical protein